MTRTAAIARWTAIAIAVAAVFDPSVPIPHSERPVVRAHSRDGFGMTPITQALRSAGFILDPAEREAATVLIASHPAPGAENATWILDSSAEAPNLRIARADATAVRFPGQAVEIRVEVEGAGITGQTTEVVLEQGGIPVATARHQWVAGQERWPFALQYLPPGASSTRLRVRAGAFPGERNTIDNAADVAVPPVRGPIRALIVEAAVTWPAMFVRRALEGDPAFDVSSVQRAAKSVATRGGNPPRALTCAALAPFEVVFLGGPDLLTRTDLDALRWFVERRGGVAIFIPDQRPSGRYVDLVGVPSFVPRIVDAPARLGGDLMASELLIPAKLPAAATVLAADGDSPVVFSARRGAGAIVFSGALDAWRNRAAAPAVTIGAAPRTDPLARFWRELVVSNVAAVPPSIDVSVAPLIAKPGEWTMIAVRVRETELPDGDAVRLPSIAARVVGPAVKVDAPIRLWPTAEPGVYAGEWRAGAAGEYDVSVIAGELRGDARVTVASDALSPSNADGEGLALAASASGGQVFPLHRAAALVDAMKDAYPARRVVRSSHPMRSPWWVVPFAGLLCAEWAIRRKRGLT